MPRYLAALLSAGVLSLAVAACGGSSSNSSSTAAAAGSGSSSSTAAAASTTAASSSNAPAAGGSSAKGSSHLAISANSGGALMFSATHLAAKAGKVTITFTNHAPEGHNFTVQTSGGQTVGSTPTFDGGSKTLTVTLKPGTYTYLCTVPGHEQGGMKGTLTVT